MTKARMEQTVKPSHQAPTQPGVFSVTPGGAEVMSTKMDRKYAPIKKPIAGPRAHIEYITAGTYTTRSRTQGQGPIHRPQYLYGNLWVIRKL